MPVILYGEWLPDQPRYGNSCITATNVYPTPNGYGPFPDLSSISDSLGATCVGAISFTTVSGTLVTFAGTATKLYQLSGSSWTDVSASGGSYTSSTFWRFVAYGDRLVATNGADEPQAFDIGSDSEFADLANAPICTYMIVIRDTLVALNCTTGNEIQWSAVSDSETWSADCGGGSQPVYEGGPVVGGTGGEIGVVMQENGITRMNFVGGDLRFTFDRIEGAVGCIAPDSIVQWKGLSFYLSDEGFQSFNGIESQNISDEKVSDTFFSVLTYSGVSSVRGALDPRNSCVVWSYPITGGSELLIYSYRINRWSKAAVEVDALHTQETTTGPVLSGFDSDNDLATFSGDQLAATVSTGDIQVAKDRNAMVTGIRGLVDAAHTGTLGRKLNTLADTEDAVSNASNSRGKCSVKANGKYHRFQLAVSATFTELTGVEIEAKPGEKI
jgi:hypothetical protein